MYRTKNHLSLVFCTLSVFVLSGCQEERLRAIENSGQAEASYTEDQEIVEILPPERPVHLGVTNTVEKETTSDVIQQPERIQQTAASEQPPSPVQPPPPTVSASTTTVSSRSVTNPAEIVSLANRYFNTFDTLSGSFTQISHDGRKQNGQLLLLRPGRMRFDYNAPSALQIISDGHNVAIRNTSNNRQDLYPLSQTPLKFLLRKEIRLDTDLKVITARADNNGAMVTVEDRSTLGGTARITLFFNSSVTTLKSWDVTDAQGKKTTVLLRGLQFNHKIHPENFVIPIKYRD